MKRDKDKELDDLFKNGLGEPQHHAAYQEGDWDAMEQMLDGPKKNKVIAFWLPILSSAAVLLIALGWWVFAPNITKQDKKPQVANVTKNQSKDSLTTAPATVAQPQIAPATQPAKSNLGNEGNKVAATKGNLGNADAAHKGNNGRTTNQYAGAKNSFGKGGNTASIVKDDIQQPASQVAVNKGNLSNADNNGTPNNASAVINSPNTVVGNSNTAVIAANTPPASTNVDKPVTNEVDSIIKANAGNSTIAATKPKITKSGDNRIQFGLSLIGAPEINGVGSFSDSKRGTNVGLLFSAGYKKFTLSTGASYAKKPYGSTYETSSAQYAVRGYVDGLADCRVLDIPINLDFQLYNKKQNKFSVGTGVSSYIMLHESYLYNYVDPSIAPSTFTVPGMHKYMFSILNLQATYTRQLNSKFGLSFQPYMKLPLAEIGNSKAKLQSAGFAVGVNWNLTPGKKR